MRFRAGAPRFGGVKVRLIAVGKSRTDPLLEVARAYVDRLGHYFPSEMVEIKEEPADKTAPVDRVRFLEAERIRKALGKDDYVIVLDERGREHTSLAVSERLSRFASEGRKSIAFVIGGPGGLDRVLMETARERWALSKMTLPHRLARVVLAEQIYRACTILRGEPYHK